jgi:hypothetical protein
MELHGADGNVQLRGDFLIGAISDDGVEDLRLPGAQSNGVCQREAFGKKFFGSGGQARRKRFLDWDQNRVFARLTTSYETLHGKQAGHALDRGIEIGAELGLEVSHPSRLLAKYN